MDIAVLNDARADLASRMAMLDIPELNYADNSKAEGWAIELTRLEQLHSFSVVLGTLEYYIEKTSEPRSVPGLGVAIDFYLDSLWEWQQCGSQSRLGSMEGTSAARYCEGNNETENPIQREGDKRYLHMELLHDD